MTQSAERPLTAEEKRAKCNECDRRLAGTYLDTCKVCNCYIVAIVRIPGKRCPIGNW